MEKFYKKLRDKLNQPPEFPFEEGQWNQLEKRLDNAGPVNGATFFKNTGWVLLWLLPLLLIGGFSWYYIGNANRQIASLQAKLDQNIHFQTDTTFRNVLVYQYDTIYQTTTVYKNLVLQETNKPSSFSPNSSAFFVNSQLLVDDFQEKLDRLSNQSVFSSEGINISSLSTFRQWLTPDVAATQKVYVFNEEAIKQNLPPLGQLEMDYLRLPIREPDLFQWYEAPLVSIDRNIPLWAYLQPTGLRVGGTAGMSTLVNSPGESSGGFNAGLLAEITFGKQFSLELGAALQEVQYKLEDDDDDLSTFPVIDPTNAGDRLHELVVKPQYIQIPFGFKYRLRPDKKWRPFINAGLVAKKLRKQQLKYEFIGNFEEYYLNQTLPGNEFSINTFYGGLGIEYAFGKKWNAFVGGIYNHQFKKGDSEINKNQQVNLNSGIFYRF